MRWELRAFFAAAIVCALLSSLLASGAMRVSRSADELSAASNSAAPTACNVHHRETLALSGSVRDSPDDGSNGVHCPDCCLAAHGGAVVLPERVASVARPLAAIPAQIRYALSITSEPESSERSSVNGARAPPASGAISA